jgi:hypothetical protein
MCRGKHGQTSVIQRESDEVALKEGLDLGGDGHKRPSTEKEYSRAPGALPAIRMKPAAVSISRLAPARLRVSH